MTEPIQMTRPQGEAADHYAEALRLEKLAGEAVHDYKLEEAERLRNLAREAWRKFKESAHQPPVRPTL